MDKCKCLRTNINILQTELYILKVWFRRKFRRGGYKSPPIILTRNKLTFEPYTNLVEHALEAHREDVALNFDVYPQQENENIIEEIELNMLKAEEKK